MSKEGTESRSRLCAEPFPYCTRHPSAPQYHRQMTARQTRTFRTQSQESITQQMKNRCFTSLWALLNGVQPQDGALLFSTIPESGKEKQFWCGHLPAHFIFRKLAMAYARMYAHQGRGGRGAKAPRMPQWVGSSSQNLIQLLTRKVLLEWQVFLLNFFFFWI